MVQDEKQVTLAERTNLEVLAAGGIYALSKDIGVNPGVIHRAQHGGNSPTLRRLWKIPKHPSRSRLIIDTTPAQIARFDLQRGNLPRRAYLDELLDGAEGVGGLDY